MYYKTYYIITFLLCVSPYAGKAQLPEKHFDVVVPSYRTKQWYRKTLDSLFSQDYENFRILFIDDCSDDKVGLLAQAYAQQEGQAHRFVLIRNKVRRYKTANLYNYIHEYCDDNAIIAMLDGDDWYDNPSVLRYLNDKYHQGYWLTWGGFRRHPDGESSFPKKVPTKVVQDNSFRQNPKLCLGAALRSFYAWLFKQIAIEDFFYKGQFFHTTSDMAKMYPMYEMAGDKIWLNDAVLYVCNTENAISDHRVAADLQYKAYIDILNRHPYKRLCEPVPSALRSVAHKSIHLLIIGNHASETIEAAVNNCSDIAQATIITTQAEQIVPQTSCPIQVIKSNNNLTQQLLDTFNDDNAEYYFIVTNPSSTQSPLPLNRYVQILDETKAYAFYLKPPARKPIGEAIFNEYYAWQFNYEKGEWHIPHLLNNVIYRKQHFMSLVNQTDARTIDQLQFQWQQIPLHNKYAVGVYAVY